MTQKGLLGEQLLGGGLLGQEHDTHTGFDFSPLQSTSDNNNATVIAEKTAFTFNPLQATTNRTATVTLTPADNPRFEFQTILPLRRAKRLLEFDLDQVGVWDSGQVRWDASTGSNTDVIVEVSTDKRNWTELSNSGDSITLFSSGDIVLGETLYVRMTLESNNDTDTPTFNNFKLDVTPR